MDDLQDIQAELGSIPAALFAQLRREAGLGDKDVISLTPNEKFRIVVLFRQKIARRDQSNGTSPSGGQGSALSSIDNQLTPQIQIYRQTMYNLHETRIPRGALGPYVPRDLPSGPQSEAQQQHDRQAPQSGTGSSSTHQINLAREFEQLNLGQFGGQLQGGSLQQQQQTPLQPLHQQQFQPSGQQSNGISVASPISVSDLRNGMTTGPSSGIPGNNSQQAGIGGDDLFGPDFLRDMVCEPTVLGTEGADIDWERDFGQWFTSDEMQLDLK